MSSLAERLTPTDAASCRAMAIECGRRADLIPGFPGRQMMLIDRARELTLLALRFEREEQNSPDPHLPRPTTGGLHTSSDDDGAKSDVPHIVGQGGDKPVSTFVKSEHQDASAAQDRNEPVSASGATVTNSPETATQSDAAKTLPGIASLGRPATENRSAKEPAIDGSGGMQDECAIHPATPSRAMRMTPLEARERGGLKGFGFTVTFGDPE